MIGLFDSGIGGLTVAREIIKRLPNYSLLYLGDTARTPYGNKSAEVVAEYGVEAVKFLLSKGAKIIIVACNTVSAVGLEAIRQAYPEVPLFDVISPAVTAIHEQNQGHHIGVIGTRTLVGSGVYQKLLNQHGKYQVTAKAAPLLVPLVEEGWLNKTETKKIIKNYLNPFKQAQIDTLVLACTHYPLLKNIISARLGKRIKVVDPAVETAKTVELWLKQNPSVTAALATGESSYFFTDLTPQIGTIASNWLKRTIKLTKVTLS